MPLPSGLNLVCTGCDRITLLPQAHMQDDRPVATRRGGFLASAESAFRHLHPPHRCAPRQVPMLILTAITRIPEVGRLIGTCPDLDVVIDHRADCPNRQPQELNGLYLFLHPGSAALVVAGPTLELLGQEHPRLAATFYHLCTGALNGSLTALEGIRCSGLTADLLPSEV